MSTHEDAVRIWFADADLDKYADAFISAGYDTLSSIAMAQVDDMLAHIQIAGHKARYVREINKLKDKLNITEGRKRTAHIVVAPVEISPAEDPVTTAYVVKPPVVKPSVVETPVSFTVVSQQTAEMQITEQKHILLSIEQERINFNKRNEEWFFTLKRDADRLALEEEKVAKERKRISTESAKFFKEKEKIDRENKERENKDREKKLRLIKKRMNILSKATKKREEEAVRDKQEELKLNEEMKRLYKNTDLLEGKEQDNKGKLTFFVKNMSDPNEESSQKENLYDFQVAKLHNWFIKCNLEKYADKFVQAEYSSVEDLLKISPVIVANIISTNRDKKMFWTQIHSTKEELWLKQ